MNRFIVGVTLLSAFSGLAGAEPPPLGLDYRLHISGDLSDGITPNSVLESKINDNGQVSGTINGTFADGCSGYAAYIDDGGVISKLPALSSDAGCPRHSYARAKNDLGVVAGYSFDADNSARAVLWVDDEVTEVPTPTGARGRVEHLNNAGDMVIVEYNSSGGTGPSYYVDGVNPPSPLAVDFWYSVYPKAMNESGQVVGEAQNDIHHFHAFLWDDGVMTDLGILSEQDYGNNRSGMSEALAINNNGVIYGMAQKFVEGTPWPDDPFVWRPFVYENGEMSQLPGVEGTVDTNWGVSDANDNGQVVGAYVLQDPDGYSHGHLVLYQNGYVYDLNVLFPEIEAFARTSTKSYINMKPYSINNRGEIAGTMGSVGWKLTLADIPMRVAIDVEPASASNDVDPESTGAVQVAVLSTNILANDGHDIDATDVDPASLRFGVLGAAENGAGVGTADVDSDGDTDLMAAFNVQDAGVACEDTGISLQGQTFSGQLIEGADTITTPECDDGGCHP